MKVPNSRKFLGAAALGRDYATVEAEFLNLTKAIEKDNLGYAQRNQDEVTEKFRHLEIRAIKVRTIGEVRNLLRIAEKQKSDKIAPESYTAAINKLIEADAFITENPYNKGQMSKLANEALFLSRRHLEIAEETKKIQEMKPEQIALWMEGTLQQTARQLSAPEMRDQSFDHSKPIMNSHLKRPKISKQKSRTYSKNSPHWRDRAANNSNDYWCRSV
jgi:hypothetical protein